MPRTLHLFRRFRTQLLVAAALVFVLGGLVLPRASSEWFMPTASAALGFNIGGRVTDSSNNGVSGVTVTLTLKQGATTTEVRTTLTDGNGDYSFTSLPGGQNSARVEPSKFGLVFNPSSIIFVSSRSLDGDNTANFTAKPAIIVTNTNDSGSGSLRQAILDAVSGDTIIFNIPASDAGCTSGVCTISLTSGQLSIGKDVVINGPGAHLLNVRRDPGASSFRIFQIAGPSNVILSGMTISNGASTLGSAISNGGTLTLRSSTVSGNTGGSGIASGGTLVVNNSTVTGNTGEDGGGINAAGTAYIINSTISGNTANMRGGGVFNTGNLTIRNSTITANKVNSGIGGGGIFNFQTVSVGNTIIAGNKGPASDWDLFGGYSSAGNNLIGVKDSSTGFTAGANGDLVGTLAAPVLARLGPLADNGGPTKTHALLPGSPAIDGGSGVMATDYSLSTDQRGQDFTRIADGTSGGSGGDVDIGAFEVQSLVVNTTADAPDADTSDALCDADAAAAGAQCTLRAAIEQANARPGTDAIKFSLAGVGPHTITLGALGPLPNLSSNMLINGPGANVLTIERSAAEGTSEFRLFWISSGQEVSLSGLTIAKGKTVGASTLGAPGKGGAIYNDHASLRITNCALSDNSANLRGGAIYNDGYNSASGATLTVAGSTMSGNQSAHGGAIYNDAGMGNTAVTLVNSTLSTNDATGNGGAIYNDGNTVTGSAVLSVTNSTITNNRADTDTSDGFTGGSGGLYLVSMSGTKVTLRNSIVAGNYLGPLPSINFDDIGGHLDAASTSFNLIGTCANCGITPGANGNQVGVVQFRLGPLANNGGRTKTHALLPGSPAVDGGSNDLLPQDIADADGDHDLLETVAFDQRGLTYPRKADGGDADTVQTVDLGAFEAHPSMERITDKIVNEDSGTSFTFNFGDRSLGAGSSMSATSSNTALLFTPNIIGHPFASVIILSMLPAPNEFGSSTITVTLTNSNGATTSQTFNLTVNPVNDPPTFTKGANQTVKEDAGAQTVQSWATNLSVGPANESTQAIDFIVTNSNNSLFAVQPAIDPSGTLTYTPAPNQSGTATVSVALHDNGGTLFGGQDTSAVQTFTITVNATNDAPTLDALGDLTIDEDAAAQNINLAGITAGGGESQTLTVTATSSNTSVVPNPTVSYHSPNSTGFISLAPVADQSGSALVTVMVSDGGGTEGGGVETVTRTFNVTVNPTNDAPTNAVPAAQSVVRNGALVFSAANSNAITVSDIDAGNNPLRITLLPASGTVTLSGTTGLSFLAGDGTSDAEMIFTGTLLSINSALNNLVYTPAQGFSGAATLILKTDDQGNTGSGIAYVAASAINITVQSGGALQFSDPTYTVTEDGGQATITVTRTGGTAGEARINYATANGTATAGSDYTAASGTLTFADGVASQSFSIPVNNDAVNEPDETINLSLSQAQGSGEPGPSLNAVLTITNDDAPTLQFGQANYSVIEGAGFINLLVTRSGDTSAPSAVKYSTSDPTDANFRCDPSTVGQPTGQASRKCDYHISVGTLRFASGEASKQLSLSIVDDVYVEGPESFTLSLSNPAGAALGQNQSVPVTILDDDVPGMPNPIDNTSFFVRQLYVDLLSRQPDPAGWNGWTNRINLCGQPGQPPPPCDRVTVGGDGFLRSGEFFDRQFFVLRLYRTGLGRILRYEDIGDLASVSGFLTAEELELNKQELTAELVARPEFAGRYAGLDDTQYVDALLQTAGVTLPDDVRRGFINALTTKSRAQVFREISERAEVSSKYLHEAQVVSAYYGFFTRNPDGAYLIYLQRLDAGEITLADLANAFINAQEYRQRFGQ